MGSPADFKPDGIVHFDFANGLECVFARPGYGRKELALHGWRINRAGSHRPAAAQRDQHHQNDDAHPHGSGVPFGTDLLSIRYASER